MSPVLPFQNSHSLVCFENRHEAGEQLAQAILAQLTQDPVPEASQCVVYALPRGGLAVAAPVARALGCPLDVVVAKKITRPDNRELAIGAVTADGYVVWSSPKPFLDQSPTLLDSALQQAQRHAQTQLLELAPATRFSPQGTIAILVDDGIATGMTMAAAVRAVRSQHPAQVWICAPVAPPDLMPFLQDLGDRVVILATPTPFFSVSRFYREFPQISTKEAAIYLQQGK